MRRIAATDGRAWSSPPSMLIDVVSYSTRVRIAAIESLTPFTQAAPIHKEEKLFFTRALLSSLHSLLRSNLRILRCELTSALQIRNHGFPQSSVDVQDELGIRDPSSRVWRTYSPNSLLCPMPKGQLAGTR